MIIVDTSVWIDHFGNVSGAHVEKLNRLLDSERVAIGDLILAEILQG